MLPEILSFMIGWTGMNLQLPEKSYNSHYLKNQISRYIQNLPMLPEIVSFMIGVNKIFKPPMHCGILELFDLLKKVKISNFPRWGEMTFTEYTLGDFIAPWPPEKAKSQIFLADARLILQSTHYGIL